MKRNLAEPAPEYGLFEVYGIELEYMVVDAETLAVMPVTDQVLKAVAGEFVSEVERGALGWSNELALHVIELKTNGPSPTLSGLGGKFHQGVREVNELLRDIGGRLMPTAMHPWMDPLRETRLWPHEQNPVYEAFNRIFGCSGHGWSNLQSMHINLPFSDDGEFGRLHAAVRAILPLLPALAASSPVIDGRVNGLCDNRLDVYRSNSARIPSISGAIIPEAVFSRDAYEREILQRIYRDLAPHDPDGILQHEWVNARGAIARFDRHAIEIRVLDTQECPTADIAFAALISETIRALSEEAWCGLSRLKKWDSNALRQIFLQSTRKADQSVIDDPRYLAAFGFPERGPCKAHDLWQHLIETLSPANDHAEGRHVLDLYLRRGVLARRISDALDAAPSREELMQVYATLCDCLAEDILFDG